MKEYLFLFRGGDEINREASPERWQQHMHRWMQWMGDLQNKGQLVGAQPLQPNGKQLSGAQKTVTDGPFAEGKEIVGGYLICKADGYDEAVRIASGCPILEFASGKVEVREIQELRI